MPNSTSVDYLLINQRQQYASKTFWFGLIVYTIGSTLYRGDTLTYRYSESIQVLGLFFLLPSALYLIHFRFESKYLRFLFIIYLLWLMLVAVRGFKFSSEFVTMMLFNDYLGALPYFAPLLVLFPKNIFFYKRIFSTIVVLGVFSLLFDLLYFRSLISRDVENEFNVQLVEELVRHYALPMTFLLLVYSYQATTTKLLALFITFLSVFFAIIRARRGMLFTLLTPLMFTAIIYFLQSKKKIGLYMISIIVAAFLGMIALQFFSESRIFNSIKSRANEDTRSGVENCFYDDMKTTDWIIGRGIAGQYYCPILGNKVESDYRPLIETDYLNIILKGGLISLVLFLLITIPAAVNGIFYSKNNLSKAAGFWILMWILNLYPTTVVSFTINYLLLWVCVGICYSPTIRNVPEEMTKIYLSKFSIS
jgi:hypothetical protein